MSTYESDFVDGKYRAMRFDFWLVFDKSGSMKMTRRNPATSRTERAMFLQITLPVSLWETPELKATLQVDDPGTTPLTINVDAANAALKQALGVDIDLVVKDATEPE